MKYVLVLDRAVVYQGHVFKIVGPFETIGQAAGWYNRETTQWADQPDCQIEPMFMVQP